MGRNDLTKANLNYPEPHPVHRTDRTPNLLHKFTCKHSPEGTENTENLDISREVFFVW